MKRKKNKQKSNIVFISSLRPLAIHRLNSVICILAPGVIGSICTWDVQSSINVIMGDSPSAKVSEVKEAVEKGLLQARNLKRRFDSVLGKCD